MKQVKETVEFLQNKGMDQPEIGIVLGTGLGKLVHEITIEQSIDYPDIPNFPVSTVESHHGKLIHGTLEGKKVIAMQGRFHYYEGYSLQQISFPIRVMKIMGIQQLLISNAGGAMNPDYQKGELMLIDDHINLLPDNPLRGANDEAFGPRFPDMSAPYSKEMNDKLKQIAKQENIKLHEGVYAAVPGPNLETRAEYRHLRMIGADVVGMSTVPEVIAANHMCLPCSAISVLTDECNPDNLEPVDIQEMIKLFLKLVEQM
jgi:purine-nucleoside phosphorylase